MPDTPATTPPHLTRTTSGRGLDYLPPVSGRHAGPDGELAVHTSSAASGPYVWIHSRENGAEPGVSRHVSRHVSAGNALRFADQIVEIVGSHYQISGLAGIDEHVAAIHGHIAALLDLLTEDEETPDA